MNSYFMTRDLLLINYKLSMTKESSIGNFITWWNVLGFSCLDLFDEFHFRWLKVNIIETRIYISIVLNFQPSFNGTLFSSFLKLNSFWERFRWIWYGNDSWNKTRKFWFYRFRNSFHHFEKKQLEYIVSSFQE